MHIIIICVLWKKKFWRRKFLKVKQGVAKRADSEITFKKHPHSLDTHLNLNH